MATQILKQYLDEDPAHWDVITHEAAERDFLRIFHSATPIFEELDLGHIIYTDVARYRLKEM